MTERGPDAVVVGAGHNGLVTAAYLARAGLRTVVLERRDEPGGALATAEIAPGYRVPALAHTVGRLWTSVVRDLRLHEHGLDPIAPEVRLFAPQPDGRSLTLWADRARTARELRGWSARDSEAYPLFDQKVRSLSSFLAHVHASTPPDLKKPSASDALAGLKLARAFRGLGKKGTRELLRVLPMAVADFVGEAFETDALRGAIAARGIQYAAMGPWSAGTTAVLLADSAGNDGGAAGQTVFVRGGPGSLAGSLASAARSSGVEIRSGAEVVRVTSSGDRVTGVALSSGEEISSPIVVCGIDPKRTLLSLVDPAAVGPSLVWRAGNLRLPGVVAKVNLALSGLPTFVADGGAESERLKGRIAVAPGIDYLERGFDASKYGRVSEQPYLEATIPSLADPGLAPEGGHVMSVLVQWTPYHRREGDWDAERDGLGDLVLKTLDALAPGISDLVVARQVITPLDLERDYGLTEGHPLHGEPGLDQLFAWRPMLGHSRYRLALRGLYLCGSGAHPGGGVTGGPGANAAREILADRKGRSRG
ncbi:MAG TPA: NAD(P)/FAD-dependent oxidoreductase [Actinomycetota bacterium]